MMVAEVLSTGNNHKSNLAFIHDPNALHRIAARPVEQKWFSEILFGSLLLNFSARWFPLSSCECGRYRSANPSLPHYFIPPRPGGHEFDQACQGSRL